MKKRFTITTFSLFTVIVSMAQTIPQQPSAISNHDLAIQYLNKSKSQQKTSTILVLTGATTGLIGVIVSIAGWSNGFDFVHPEKGGSAIDAGSALLISGTCIMATGIPFAFASKHNKKKAELLLSNEKVMPATSFILGRVYSIKLVIPL